MVLTSSLVVGHQFDEECADMHTETFFRRKDVETFYQESFKDSGGKT